jgi:hypothetical protein
MQKGRGGIKREQTRGRKKGIGREETVIDYGIVNEEAWERVEEFRIGDRVKSDHLETVLKKRKGGKEQRNKGWGIGIKLLILIFLELLWYV